MCDKPGKRLLRLPAASAAGILVIISKNNEGLKCKKSDRIEAEYRWWTSLKAFALYGRWEEENEMD